MDATCEIQDSIHVFRLVYKYVSRILGTYHNLPAQGLFLCRMARMKFSPRAISTHFYCQMARVGV